MKTRIVAVFAALVMLFSVGAVAPTGTVPALSADEAQAADWRCVRQDSIAPISSTKRVYSDFVYTYGTWYWDGNIYYTAVRKDATQRLKNGRWYTVDVDWNSYRCKQRHWAGA